MTDGVFFTGHQLANDGTRRFCLITGAAGGIGRAIAADFTDAGYAVIGTDQVPMPAGLPLAAYLQADLVFRPSKSRALIGPVARAL